MNLVPPELLPNKGITYSNSYRHRLEKAGLFPRRVRLSPLKYAYVESEIEAWQAARIAERDTAKSEVA